MADCVALPIRLIPTASVTSELIGVKGSCDSVVQEETLSLESPRKESTATKWTDEKHRLYLKSMEASFVDQLYSSTDFLGWYTQKDCSADSIPSRTMQARTCIPSDQFKVLRGGGWSKINFKRNESQLNRADGSHILSASPRIRHFKFGCRDQAVTFSALQEKPSSTATSNQLCCQDSVDSSTEVTDQNFSVEDVKAIRMCSMKRRRTSVVASSSNDQVVPIGTFPVTEHLAENPVSPKK